MPADAPLRIGSVPYLNAVPLTFGIEPSTIFLPPSRLATELHSGGLDAALLSITEPLLHDGYDLLSKIGVVSRGPVFSVGVAHRVPLDEVEEIHVDTASCTSVNLLRVLLAARGLAPRLTSLSSYAGAAHHPAVLLIGNAAIDFRRAGHPHHWWDLGEAWQLQEGLPFVYAAWVLPRNRPSGPVKTILRDAASKGITALPRIIQSHPDYDPAFRRRYLTECIHFEIDDAAQDGVTRFTAHLRRILKQPVFPPHWVD